MAPNKINIRNKRATFDYEILEKFVAGIQLTGTEIKSIRLGKASLTDCYCFFQNRELWVKNLQISEYFWGSYNNHDPKRDKKLLLRGVELKKLERKIKDTGLSIVPLGLFIASSGYAKLDIALAKGKKAYDKREDIKKKDARRDMDRAMKR